MLSGKQQIITVIAIAMSLSAPFLLHVDGTAPTSPVINEFLAWPPGGEEYIELYNPSNDAVILDGWYLDDQEGGSQPFSLQGLSIPPSGHLALWGNETGIRLNNNGDSVRLLDPEHGVVDEHTYDFVDPNVPVSRLPDGEKWFSPITPTPGITNPDPPTSAVKNILFSSLLPVSTSSWEFVSLKNHGPKTSLEGWRISDGEGCWQLPDYNLSNGEDCVVAANASCFQSEAGAEPDIVPAGEMIMSDDGEGVFLFDPWGRLADAIWYGNIVPEPKGWTGKPISAPRRGDVIHREGDTNSSNDWPALNNTPVGATFFDGGEHVVSRAVCFVSPDEGAGPVLDVIEAASRSLDINLYELTKQTLVDALVDACERDVKVRLLLEGSPVSWNWTHTSQSKAKGSNLEAYAELNAASKIETAGGDVRFISWSGDVGSRYERYRFDHAKYAIADEETMVLGSENWKPTGLPEPGYKGNRGWGIVLSSSTLCARLGEVFESDWNGMGDVVDFGQEPYVAPPSWFSPHESKTYPRPSPFSSLVLDTATQAQLIIGPENNLDTNGVLGAIEGAKQTVYVELLDLAPEWFVGGESIANPYVSALLDAARRGVEIRVLLDSKYGDGAGGDEDNLDAVIWLNQLAKDENLPLEARSADLDEMNVDKIHNKGMIVDNEIVLVSSMNWNANSALRNREMGVLLQSEAAASYFAEVFLWDWEAGAPPDQENSMDKTSLSIETILILIGVGVALVILVAKKRS